MTPRPDARNVARKAVLELRDIVTWLAASLLPGTHKPYTAPPMSAEKQAERDHLARLEKGTGRLVGKTLMTPLGESPAPMDLNVMDLLVEILTTAEELADAVCRAVWRPGPQPKSSWYADPSPFLDLVLMLLDQVPSDDELGVLPLVHRDCEALVFRARSMLGLVTDGQLLDALCPWCGGRTSKHPVGGAKTLRVRLVKVRAIPKQGETEARFDDLPAIVCEGGSCDPPTEAAGAIRHRGMPTWFLDTEGSWLARQIEVAAAEMADVEVVVAGLAS